MRNLKLTIAYDGTNYHGFQRQINAITVQEVLENRLKKLFSHPLKILIAARTDTGVHAYGQVISFQTDSSIPVDRICMASLRYLPEDIVVVKAEEVPLSFNARRSAIGKIYRYRLLNSFLPNPLEKNYSWHYHKDLDVEKMNEAMKKIVGTYDFSSFRAAGGAPMSPIRTIFSAECKKKDEIIEFEFFGSGFLYHMVRNLVGTIVDVGRNRFSLDDFQEILEAKDRKRAGRTAPAQGLYLISVKY